MSETEIKCSLKGEALLANARLNKGTAFTEEERIKYELTSRLPPVVETLQQQIDRAYEQYKSYGERVLEKNFYLSQLSIQNQTLFYALLSQHLVEMIPIIYTPTEGDAIMQYSDVYRYPEGCFLDIEHKDPQYIKHQLGAFGTKDSVKYIILTDSEGILGIGDQGVGGVLISVAKGHLMTLCAGLDPNSFLPIVLDVGTNNPKHRSNPQYMGLKRDRVHGEEYDQYLSTVLGSIKEVFPHAFIHFEDFGLKNAKRILDKYTKEFACFNDDIQGTGAVALAAIVAALQVTKSPLTEQRIMIFGAGTAGIGISNQIISALVGDGLSKQQAFDRIYLVDRYGLLLEKHANVATEGQKPFLKKNDGFQDIKDDVDLETAISRVKPTVLLGCSGQAGKFTEKAMREMAKHVEQPIIFPISNPTKLMEAKPDQIDEWTNGKALLVTGSPLPPIQRNGKEYIVSQCNNALLYPALGVGCVLSGCKFLTDSMMKAASDALATVPKDLFKSEEALLPDLQNAREISRHITLAVLKQARKENLSTTEYPTDDKELSEWILKHEWNPTYKKFV
ncbi:malic enzyme, malate dehydrogenase (oxaloacetate decarboxylating), Mae2 [Schizosaccharomyces osmophilus]|uniref:Malic enzyme n=1 Tax=Schizosaccharomyces osmophilus TaxID=2545709 RepID=A0AAF0AXJ1_9SCHI|nr:malic enzyme, malate dehydrogenase (oxaloacetate decarboxylating), Mae2 [Schizosaccharomyces osmophilus]WBW74822.1 malic enzyme, malate dehydrogenase (oxaloacetate decarboxylating), Mae2 [Schizosaccharomyces osmophilus]